MLIFFVIYVQVSAANINLPILLRKTCTNLQKIDQCWIIYKLFCKEKSKKFPNTYITFTEY